MNSRFSGILAAVFSPMDENGKVNTGVVPAIVDSLVADGVSGIYVCGSTGEGPLLAREERMEVAEAYTKACKDKMPVIVQVGHDSIAEAKVLAEHAAGLGADAVAAVPPTYFKCPSVENLVDCMAEISEAAGDAPFYYYHVPALTDGVFSMVDFLRLGEGKIRNLEGIKYSALTVFECQECLNYAEGKYNILFGCDEMLLSGLVVGVPGAVGSTFNFAAPLYNKIMDAYKAGDLERARELQLLSVKMVNTLFKYRGQPAFKAMMGILGVDCGPNRLPLKSLDSDEVAALKKDLEDIGFFDWGRTR
ncbi:N-acetylneuraminate lyase [Anaerohalosphaera lusitana]|uniref:N-acetylneuraminate lyase n=1 Tax=Anaerohalosphaera lusitana TaxID=1936003 RepID=A0A1U9NL69_9BACT|nr:dihydrodipicolinate synthase family protein [Anaerohalosphaera lusitana]AQT68681.1 N-acetylneuraminate lyase [Anaerohalosphaera lusitana]